MKEETIIQILNSLTTVGEKSLDDLIEYYGHYMFNDLIAMVFLEIFIIFIFYLFYKLFPKYRYKDGIVFTVTLVSIILGILGITIVFYFITGVSEYLAYLQNPLGATLNYLITGR
jgi:predicted PurR-regulated permease PerM